MRSEVIEQYITNCSNRVAKINVSGKEIEYDKDIMQYRKIKSITGDEEIVRAYILSKLVNELGYEKSAIEIEKEYDIGRPKVNKPRIDVIVRNQSGNAFLYMELKSPDEYEKDKDEIIEKQLFNLASQEQGQGKKVRYLVLYSLDISDENKINDKCMIIDYEKYKSFEEWKNDRNYSEDLPEKYGRVQKEPYIKGGKKDLIKDYNHKTLDSMRQNLHNVLWGGGGTDDNEVFSSLTNIILAKIQDESEKRTGEKYDFQVMYYQDNDDEYVETNQQLFERINQLYRRALKQRLYINDVEKLEKSFVIDENKFSLQKLKYAISSLERYSFVDGKNSLNGKDILGDFFEGIITTGFKQSKGQFFTHINIVKFMLYGLQTDKLAIDKVNKELEIPYMIDPSAGSGTFLIEYMKFITKHLKYENRDKLDDTRDIEDKFNQWFLPENRENKWAKDYIYGSEINFNLGIATKVNMILHGDGSTNIFVKDGLLPFSSYNKEVLPNVLKYSQIDKLYFNKNVNEQFDLILTNPPFSVELDDDTKKNLNDNFVFGNKKNSENLFIERYYQLLKPNGRMAVVLPESVYDTTENKYIRLFLYKYFKIKAIVSLPQVTFAPYTTTKTSILFAQKKTNEEIEKWNLEWDKSCKEWNDLKTRALNIVDVYKGRKNKDKLPSIKNLSLNEERNIIVKILNNIIDNNDRELELNKILEKYEEEIQENSSFDKATKDEFGYINTTWVFNQVAQTNNNEIFMAEVENVGYKRKSKGQPKKMPNELYRESKNGEILYDDGIKETVLDYMREIKWD